MTNFIFKSSRRLIKNVPISNANLNERLKMIQSELRHQRQDNIDIMRMLNKLLIDKHLQMEVDDFYEKSNVQVS